MSLIFKGIYLGGGGGGSANLTTLDVTPMTNYQSISPEEGYDGFSLVNVSAVNSSIDPNITASNIKLGVAILGVSGTYVSDSNMFGVSMSSVMGELDENGVLTKSRSAYNLDFSGVKQFGKYVYHNEWNGKNIVNSVSAPDAVYIGQGCFDSAFYASPFFGSALTSVSFPNVKYIANYGFNQAFSTSNVTSANFSNLLEIREQGMTSAFSNARNLVSINFSNLRRVYSYGLGYAFTGCNKYYSKTIEFSSLYGLSAAGSDVSAPFSSTFRANNTSGISRIEIRFPSLTTNFYELGAGTRSSANLIFTNMLYNRSGCNVHFPENLEPVINSWADVINGFGGNNTTILFDLPNASTPPDEMWIENGKLYCFGYMSNMNIPEVTSFAGICNLYGAPTTFYTASEINFPNLRTIEPNSYTMRMCADNYNLVSFAMPSLESIDNNNGFRNFCQNCLNLTSVDFRNLYSISSNYAFYYGFANCLNLTSVDFSGLTRIDGLYVFEYAFRNSGIKNVYFNNLSICGKNTFANAFFLCNDINIYFPAFTSSSVDSNACSYMLFNTSNATIHFPNNFNYTYLNGYNASSPSKSWNGTNVTILKDL